MTQLNPNLEWKQRDSTGPIDIGALRRAHEEFIAGADGLSFVPPPPGEWDAHHVLAHVAAANFSIASVALAVAAGQQPYYDNRATLDPWHLRVLTERGSKVADMLQMVRNSGELLCLVAEHLPSDDVDYPLPTLIVSHDDAVLNDTVPLRALIDGVGEAHLPLHAKQLRALAAQ
jgi:hypothetical protein